MQAQASRLLEIIKARIAKGGPMSVADYMSLALIDPDYGYYTRGDPLGTQGDFITSPEISQIFGELIGLWLAEQWRSMGKPEAALVELGPGRGTLMADMLRATEKIAGFHDALTIHMIEASPVLQQKQMTLLSGKHPHIRWHMRFSEVPEKPLLLVANEFFDALPIRQFVYNNDSWYERMIEADGHHRLRFTLRPEQPPSIVLERRPEPNHIYEYSHAADDMAGAICRHIDAHGGVALIVDYGYEGNGRGDTLQAVRGHKYHEPLADPGTADLTAHVDFDQIKRIAQGCKLSWHGTVPQGIFLSELGAHIRAAILCQSANDDQKASIIAGLNRLTSNDQMGDLFKVLCISTSDHPRPQGF